MDTGDIDPQDFGGGDGELSEDVRELLSDPHVRFLLQYLRKKNDPADVPTVATYVAAGVTDTPPEDVPDEVKSRVQTILYRGQLPELARYGIIEFDREGDTVSLTS
jgi:hypothetical protein